VSERVVRGPVAPLCGSEMNDAFVHLVFVLLLGVVVAIEAKHKLLPRCVPLEVLLPLSARARVCVCVCVCVRERERENDRSGVFGTCACCNGSATTHSLNPRRTHLPA
jgi:hypothetical protein